MILAHSDAFPFSVCNDRRWFATHAHVRSQVLADLSGPSTPKGRV